MGPLTRYVKAGIGLQAELKAAKEERKMASNGHASQANGGEEDDGHESSDDDEHFGGGKTGEDDLADEPPPYSEDELKELSTLLPPKASPGGFSSKLSCPVIIPQRRPGTKNRGFARAYAPAMADCGIDQETFLTFLKNFHKSSQVKQSGALEPILKLISER